MRGIWGHRPRRVSADRARRQPTATALISEEPGMATQAIPGLADLSTQRELAGLYGIEELLPDLN